MPIGLLIGSTAALLMVKDPSAWSWWANGFAWGLVIAITASRRIVEGSLESNRRLADIVREQHDVVRQQSELLTTWEVTTRRGPVKIGAN